MPSGRTLGLELGHPGSEGPERPRPGDGPRLCPDARGDARTCRGRSSAPQKEEGRHPRVSPGTGGHTQHRLPVLLLSSQSPANMGSETCTRPRATSSLIPSQLLPQAARLGIAGPGTGTTWRWTRLRTPDARVPAHMHAHTHYTHLTHTPALPLAHLLREGTRVGQGRGRPEH